MDLGLILTGGSARGNVELGVRAEEAGFDAVYACEFFNQQTFPVLGALAQATERIRLGTGIASAFVRSPLTHATAAMDIDELSQGRMILGLGSGTSRMNEEWFGVPFSKPAARSRELLVLLRQLFRAAGGLGFRFEGDFYDLKIPVYSRPGAAREEIPLWLAAVNRGMMAAAGAQADGMVGHPIATRRWHREVTLPTLREAEAGASREPGACQLVPYVMTSLSDDREQAIRDAKGQIGFYYTVSVYRTILDYHGLPEVADACRAALATFDIRAMAEAIPDSLVDEIAIACTPDEARDRLAQWDDLAEEVMLYAPQVGVAPARVRANLDTILDVFKR
ncbi:MAG: LLM class flavin-dependent oxidoreductase [Myxococcota bacterium]|nr:LLM class flavin-dependent oxidoreductase [Myxococcota bacterium]